jgi:hypothetical protein
VNYCQQIGLEHQAEPLLAAGNRVARSTPLLGAALIVHLEKQPLPFEGQARAQTLVEPLTQTVANPLDGIAFDTKGYGNNTSHLLW